MLLSLWLFVQNGFAEPGTYEMNDLGGAVVLERGWDLAPGGWSDASFKFQRSNQHVQMDVWYIPQQPDINEANAAAWGVWHSERVNQQGGIQDATVTGTRVETIANRPTAVAEIAASFQGQTHIVAHVLSFASGGKTIFIRAMGQRRYAAEVMSDAKLIAETMTVADSALPAEQAIAIEGEASVTLPEGWRKPHETEMDAVREISAQAGEAELSASQCMVGVHANPGQPPDVLFSCGTYMHLGPLDEHSFDGIEQEVHERFFGNSDAEVATAQPVTIGDRMGLLYKPKAGYRLALAPYDKGLMMTWGIAADEQDEALDAAVTATLSSMVFTGPEGGAPIIAPDKWISYYVKYRPTSAPVVLSVLGLVGLIGGVGFLATRKRPSRFDLDDE